MFSLSRDCLPQKQWENCDGCSCHLPPLHFAMRYVGIRYAWQWQWQTVKIRLGGRRDSKRGGTSRLGNLRLRRRNTGVVWAPCRPPRLERNLGRIYFQKGGLERNLGRIYFRAQVRSAHTHTHTHTHPAPIHIFARSRAAAPTQVPAQSREST